MENYFLLSVGYWNLLGSIVLYLMLNESIADTLLRKWSEIITYSYDIGKYGSLWLWWAATTNTFLGIVNLFAVNWTQTSKTTVIYGDLWVYGVLLFPTIAALKHENYGKGHYINVFLEVFWILWAIYGLFIL